MCPCASGWDATATVRCVIEAASPALHFGPGIGNRSGGATHTRISSKLNQLRHPSAPAGSSGKNSKAMMPGSAGFWGARRSRPCSPIPCLGGVNTIGVRLRNPKIRPVRSVRRGARRAPAFYLDGRSALRLESEAPAGRAAPALQDRGSLAQRDAPSSSSSSRSSRSRARSNGSRGAASRRAVRPPIRK